MNSGSPTPGPLHLSPELFSASWPLFASVYAPPDLLSIGGYQ